MPASIDVYLFALLAAIFWGSAPVVFKKGLEAEGTSMLATIVASVVGFTLFFGLSTALYGPEESYLGLPPAGIAVFLLGGAVGSALGRLAQYAGVNRVGASVNTAVMNTRPLFASVLGVTLLGEPYSIWLAIGVVTITGGVVSLSFSRGGDIRGWQVYELAFPLAGALAYGGGNVIRRYGFTLTGSDPISAIVWNELAALLVLGGYVVGRYGRDAFAVSARTYGFFALGSLFSSIGLLSLFVALSRGPVIIVDPLSATSPLFAALFTYLFLRRVEVVTRGVIAGAALVVVGVVFVTVA